MALSSIFSIGLSGVNAFAAGLEAVSNNIANSQTAGYKKSRTNFADLVTANAPGGGLAGGGAAATNQQLISEQGAITRTNSATDLAVSGNGLFVVSDSATPGAGDPFYFTRAGGFSVQADGTLMNEAGFFLQGASLSGAGSASIGGLSGLETIDVDNVQTLTAATSNLSLRGNLSASALPGETITQGFQIFDDTGASRQLALTFTNRGAGQWDGVAAFLDGAQEIVATGAINFDGNGLIDRSASSFPVSFSNPSNAGQIVGIDLSGLNAISGATQFSSASSDGAAAGDFTGVDISADGLVTALYSNGLQQDIYQIALADFVNKNGLKGGPRSTFLQSTDAGNLTLDIPQSGRHGAIESQAIETSTVDIGQEFSTLIETQRAYAANTRVISVADELLTTLTQTAT